MIKRFLNIILIFSILLFSCFPVYALETYTLECFSETTYVKDDTGERLNFINTYKDIYPYIYYIHIAYNYSATHSRLIASTGPVEITAPSSRDIAFVNNGTENVTIVSHNSMFNNITVAAGETSANIRYHSITGTKGMYDDTGLLIYNGDCVNSTHCSPDIYVELKEDTGDYEEDGVIIKGLTSFFNKMTSVLDNILNEIKGIVDSIIGIPEDGYFAEKIENIKTIINEKYNLDSLFSFFEDMKGIEASTPDFSFDKELSINGLKIPFDFSIDFSWFDGDIKNIIFLLLRGTGYPLLIIYNLNQVYLLFRGRKFFNEDGGEES